MIKNQLTCKFCIQVNSRAVSGTNLISEVKIAPSDDEDVFFCQYHHVLNVPKPTPFSSTHDHYFVEKQFIITHL